MALLQPWVTRLSAPPDWHLQVARISHRQARVHVSLTKNNNYIRDEVWLRDVRGRTEREGGGDGEEEVAMFYWCKNEHGFVYVVSVCSIAGYLRGVICETCYGCEFRSWEVVICGFLSYFLDYSITAKEVCALRWYSFLARNETFYSYRVQMLA